MLFKEINLEMHVMLTQSNM